MSNKHTIPDLTAWNQSFERIVQAASVPAKHTLCAHMWEWEADENQREVADVLGVMSGNETARYHDAYRDLAGNAAHGFLGLACTAIHANAKIQLFTDLLNHTHTGMLLLDAPPIFVSPMDSKSRYEHAKGRSMAELSVKFDHNYISQNERLIFTQAMDTQKIDTRTLDRVYLDPTSRPILARARDAYTKMMDALCDINIIHTHNEVCVNAKTEHIAGIVVQDYGTKNPKTRDEWKARLMDDSMLLSQLQTAMAQIDQVSASMREQGIGRAPTIIIYKPLSDEKLLHFPPSRANRLLLEEVVKEREMREPDVYGALPEQQQR